MCVYIFPLNSVSTLRGSYGKFFVAGGSKGSKHRGCGAQRGS